MIKLFTLKSIFYIVFFIFLQFSYFNCVAQNSNLPSSDVNDSSSFYPEPEVIQANLAMLTPPDGFVASSDFDGYINMNMGAAILMSVIDNISYSILKASMTDSFFIENNMNKLSERQLMITEDIGGVLYKCQFAAQGHEFIRMIVYAGDLTKTLWLNITYPLIVDEQLEPAIMKSLQSINLSN